MLNGIYTLWEFILSRIINPSRTSCTQQHCTIFFARCVYWRQCLKPRLYLYCAERWLQVNPIKHTSMDQVVCDNELFFTIFLDWFLNSQFHQSFFSFSFKFMNQYKESLINHHHFVHTEYYSTHDLKIDLILCRSVQREGFSIFFFSLFAS